MSHYPFISNDHVSPVDRRQYFTLGRVEERDFLENDDHTSGGRDNTG